MTIHDSADSGRAAESARAAATARLLLRGPDGDIVNRLFWPSTGPASPRTSPTVLLVGADQPAPLDRDAFGRALATRSGAAVLAMPWQTVAAQASVEYALGWLADHAAELDSDPTRLVVLGLGAAAEAAAVAARGARDSGWPNLARHIFVLPLDTLAAREPQAQQSLAGICACTLILDHDAATPPYADALAQVGVPVRERRVPSSSGAGPLVAALAADLADLPKQAGHSRRPARTFSNGPLVRGSFDPIAPGNDHFSTPMKGTTMSMHRITSADGTTIAFDRLGDGPAVIMMSGGPVDRMANASLAELLAADFTVFNYDRRGRGDSGDAATYQVDREYEDIAALIDEAGGSAMAYGTSGGGIIALEAAARGLALTKLAVWEPPFILPGSRPPVPADYEAKLRDLLAQNRRGDMVELFLTAAAGIPAEFVAGIRQSPFWPAQEAIAHALVYDAMIVGDFALPAKRLATVSVPTVVIDGGTTDWLSQTADAVARTLPNAHRRTLTGQPHNVDDAAIAPAIVEHFAG